MQSRARNKCPHCRTGPETYRYLSGRYVFDVDAARAIVQDGRDPVEMEVDDVRHCVDNSRIYQPHLQHVHTRYPGIVAHLWFPTPDGELVHSHLLIDGNHRAARCLQLWKPFFIHVLSEEESLRILVKSPAPVTELIACC